VCMLFEKKMSCWEILRSEMLLLADNQSEQMLCGNIKIESSQIKPADAI